MRICLLGLGAAMALASPAFAQMGTMTIGPGGSPSQNSYQYMPDSHALPQAYVKKVTALSYRTLEIKAEDGGRLTPEHLASLQQELDQLRRQYRVPAGFRIKP